MCWTADDGGMAGMEKRQFISYMTDQMTWLRNHDRHRQLKMIDIWLMTGMSSASGTESTIATFTGLKAPRVMLGFLPSRLTQSPDCCYILWSVYVFLLKWIWCELSGEGQWACSHQWLPQYVHWQQNLAEKMVLSPQRLCSLLIQSPPGAPSLLLTCCLSRIFISQSYRHTVGSAIDLIMSVCLSVCLSVFVCVHVCDPVHCG